MSPKTLKIKQGKIHLPKQIQDDWENAEIFVKFDTDSIYIKKISSPSFKEFRKRFKKAGKLISKKDLDEAIKQTRN